MANCILAVTELFLNNGTINCFRFLLLEHFQWMDFIQRPHGLYSLIFRRWPSLLSNQSPKCSQIKIAPHATLNGLLAINRWANNPSAYLSLIPWLLLEYLGLMHRLKQWVGMTILETMISAVWLVYRGFCVRNKMASFFIYSETVFCFNVIWYSYSTAAEQVLFIYCYLFVVGARFRRVLPYRLFKICSPLLFQRARKFVFW
jgi:hypothetical protein